MGFFDNLFKNDAATTTPPTTASLLTQLDQEIAALEQQLAEAKQAPQKAEAKLTTARNILAIKQRSQTVLAEQHTIATTTTEQAVLDAAKQAVEAATQAVGKAQQQIATTYQTILDLENALTKKRAEKQNEEAANQPQLPTTITVAATAPTSNTNTHPSSQPQLQVDLTATRKQQLQQYPYYVQTIDKLSAQYHASISNISAADVPSEVYQNKIRPVVQTLSWLEQLLNENQQHAVKKHLKELANTILANYRLYVSTRGQAQDHTLTQSDISPQTDAIDSTQSFSLDQLRKILQIKPVQANSFLKNEHTDILDQIQNLIGTEIDKLITAINTLADDEKKPAFFKLLNEFYLYFDPILATPVNQTKSTEPNNHEKNILKLYRLANALGLLKVVDSTYNAAGAVITPLGLSAASSVTSENPFGSLRTFKPNKQELHLLTALHQYTYQQQQQIFLHIMHEQKTVSNALVAGQILLKQQTVQEKAVAAKEQLDQLHTEKVTHTQAHFQQTISDLQRQSAETTKALQKLPADIASLKKEYTDALTEIEELEKKLKTQKDKASELENTKREKEQALTTAQAKNTEIADTLAKIPTTQAAEIATLEQVLLQQKQQVDDQLIQQLNDIATQTKTAALTQKQAAYTEIIQSATQYAATRSIPVKDALITLLTERYLQDNSGFDKNLARLAVTHLIETNSFDLADMPAALDHVANATSSFHSDASSSTATELRTEAPYTSGKTTRQIANEYAKLREINTDPNSEQYEFIVNAAASAARKNIPIHDALVDMFVTYYLKSINRPCLNPQSDYEFNNMKQAAEKVIANKLFNFTEFRKVYLINGLVESYRASHSVSDDDVQMIELLEQVATALVQHSNIEATLENLVEAFNAHVVSALTSSSATTATEPTVAAAASGAGASTSDGSDSTIAPTTVSTLHAALFAPPAAPPATSSSSTQPESAAAATNGDSSLKEPIANPGDDAANRPSSPSLNPGNNG